MRQTSSVHARSALFDLFGDHLRSRGGRAPVAALVRVLAPLGVTGPAVRTAISRMVRQGWLEPVRLDAGPGYALTRHATQRLDDAAARIYRIGDKPWDGSWDLLVLEPVKTRAGRERVRNGLGFLGYAPISDSTWIGPFASDEATSLLDDEAVGHTRFAARDDDPRERAALAWDLDALADAYTEWHQFAADLIADPGAHLPGDPDTNDDEGAFAVRSLLVHEWRKFLFTDPGLPAELLPADWPGDVAARFFAAEAGRLLPSASRFVDRCLKDPAHVSPQTDQANPPTTRRTAP